MKEVKSLLVLTYFNWAGKPEEFKEFATHMKTIGDDVSGVKLVGIFIPTSEWHYVMVWDATRYEKVLETYKAYSEKYGRLKFSLGKMELLHTRDEVPFL